MKVTMFNLMTFSIVSGRQSLLALNSFEPRDFLDVASPVVSSGEGAVPDLVALIRSCGYRMRVRGLASTLNLVMP